MPARIRLHVTSAHVSTIIHAGRDPRLGSDDYDIDEDVETAIAETARERGWHHIMLSSRKVYGTAPSPITEETPARPTDAYGRQKLAMEQRLAAILGDRLTILRIGNVMGFEPGRRTFMGAMLDGLVQRGEIIFDMSPVTARDFLPVETVAEIIAALAASPPGGVVNVGSGLPTPTGELAKAVIAGFGRGKLTVTDAGVSDAFVLDVGRMSLLTGIRTRREDILGRAKAIGARLREESGAEHHAEA